MKSIRKKSLMVIYTALKNKGQERNWLLTALLLACKAKS